MSDDRSPTRNIFKTSDIGHPSSDIGRFLIFEIWKHLFSPIYSAPSPLSRYLPRCFLLCFFCRAAPIKSSTALATLNTLASSLPTAPWKNFLPSCSRFLPLWKYCAGLLALQALL